MRVVVIGGGVMGLSCGWRLAQKGWGVTVLESRGCGEGASLAALGALWPAGALNVSEGARWQRECLRGYGGFLRELEAASGMTVGYKRLGRVEVMASRDAAERGRAEVAAANGTWGDWGVGACMAFMEAGTWEGTAMPFGAVRCAVTAQVRVGELVAALRAACERAGAEVLEGMCVVGVRREIREWRVSAEKREFAAQRVLIAAGAWSSAWAPAVAVKPVRGQGLALRMGREVEVGCIVKKGPVYVVPWAEEGEALVGSTTEDIGFDEGVTGEAREMLLRAAGELTPGLRGVEVLRQWSGLRPKGRKGAVMGQAGEEGMWVCTGHYKTGIGMCGEAGRIMAERMSG